MWSDKGAVGAPQIDEHPSPIRRPQLGVATARVAIGEYVKRDIAIGMTPDCHTRRRIELLALTASVAREVIHDDAHSGTVARLATR